MNINAKRELSVDNVQLFRLPFRRKGEKQAHFEKEKSRAALP